ncbi:MAG: C4-type zinc ribbon domain-containing protein [Limisphaerales bacterium]
MNKTLTSLIQLQELMRRYENAGHPASLRRQVDRLRTKLPKNILRQFDHLAELGRLPVAQVSASGACGSCHMKLPPADMLHIRSSDHQFPICPFCGCFLYAAAAVAESKELTEAGL